ncbi:hypothetical protein HBI56_036250 [Parastagonospora nodorum]|nr:hypothetical protein HBH53_016800 [Parastagonospora nodorum]KAH3986188.1 hypothetical protein HBH52_047950 [Parastagonospora nodorum]KAH3988151.1 hypothetical protein HBH51_001130 [Parastagonospora nodorum]KAH4005030.1 hypothetical protein HBI10_039630 [Parastagonospora nodorum]KAH4030647.1 hypothetical protein HBI13_023080 [Parastagonospora nodorum]
MYLKIMEVMRLSSLSICGAIKRSISTAMYIPLNSTLKPPIDLVGEVAASNTLVHEQAQLLLAVASAR